MSGETSTARVVQLTVGASDAAFFLIPGTGGRIDGFEKLAHFLNISLPVHAIEARGQTSAGMPDSNVEETARHYLTLIRQLQTTGPYFLLGHSFGGLVALQIAQSLLDEGEEIACLIMLDTATPEHHWPLTFYLRNRAAKFYRIGRKLLTDPLYDNLKFLRGALNRRRLDFSLMPADAMVGPNVARVVEAHSIARKSYRLKFYPGRIIFFRPLVSPSGYERLWRDHVAELAVFSASGDHLSMVEMPHAPLLAKDLTEQVNRASLAAASETEL